MLKFLIGNIFAMFGVFQQTVGTNSSSCRLVPLFVSGRFYTGPSQEKQIEASMILKCQVSLYTSR
jgi:hypothetical protein